MKQNILVDEIQDGDLIIGDGQYYSMDCYKTQLNNNVLVVGAAGSGKTRSIVSPNILQASGSYIITDPKGQLHKKYADYLRGKGYRIQVLDFTNPAKSDGYNPFAYVDSHMDIQCLAHMIYDGSLIAEGVNHHDMFWDESSELLLSAIMAYLWEAHSISDQNMGNVLRLLEMCNIDENNCRASNPLDTLFKSYEGRNPDSYAVKQYNRFRVAAGKTLCSILISLNSRLGKYTTPEVVGMLKNDTLNLKTVGDEKTAIFVVVSDKDRTMDGLANLFYSQAMNILCKVADEECPDGRLDVPVRFILDDFATNCKITDFPRMISSIRSRGISTMLILQAESQLQHCYGYDGRTVIANCDTYVYLGGNDLETAEAVATRCDMPVTKILSMPISTNFVFRRGQEPVYGNNFLLEPFEQIKLNTSRERA